MKRTALIPVADGVEDIETIAVVDTLRRAGIEVTVAAIAELTVTLTRGTKIIADQSLAECVDKTYDLIALPGGMPGAEHLRDCDLLTKILQKQVTSGRFYAGICAAPVVVLQYHGLLDGKKATAHPALSDQLKNPRNDRVVVDGNCITSQGPGTAIEFALKLIELLVGAAIADKVAHGMIV